LWKPFIVIIQKCNPIAPSGLHSTIAGPGQSFAGSIFQNGHALFARKVLAQCVSAARSISIQYDNDFKIPPGLEQNSFHRSNQQCRPLPGGNHN
jgi:hypothetical protein